MVIALRRTWRRKKRGPLILLIHATNNIEKANQTSFTSLCWAFTIFLYQKNILTAWGAAVFQKFKGSEASLWGQRQRIVWHQRHLPNFPINGDGRWSNQVAGQNAWHIHAPKIQWTVVSCILQSIIPYLKFHHETNEQRTPLCMFPVLFCFGKYITLLYIVMTTLDWDAVDSDWASLKPCWAQVAS